MGGVIADVCSRLRDAGVSGSMPMAVIDRASLPTMQVVCGTVDTLPGLVQGRDDLTGPAMVLLGEVVGLRERLVGALPRAAPAPDIALATALTALPNVRDDGLRILRTRI